MMRWLRCVFVPGMVLLSGCSNDPSGTNSTTRLEVVQAPSAVGLPGYTLYDTVIVRAIHGDGAPRPGIAIQWVADPGATVTPLAAVTDSAGRAAALWTLAPEEGEQYLEARTLEDSSVAFAVTAQLFQADLLYGTSSLGCGLRSGDIWCFNRDAGDPVSIGWGGSGTLVTPAPVRVSTGRQFTQMSAGPFDACGLDSIGGITCYPNNHGATFIPTLPAMSSIANGGEYGRLCGLTVADSTPYCFSTAAVQLDTVRLVEFSVEAGLACGRRVTGAAVCWQRTGGVVTALGTVPGGHQFSRIAVGLDFACGLDGSSILWCWGDSRYGQLGSVGGGSATPIQLLDNVSAFSIGRANAIAIRHGAAVHWGFWNGAVAPNAVPGLAGKAVVALSRGSAECVLLAGGRVWCAEELWVTDGASTFWPVQPVE